MVVRIPHDLDPDARDEAIALEKAYTEELQRAGKHLWRIAGEYANFSVFDVESYDELHQILSGLPLFPYMDVHVTPLSKQTSGI